MTDKAKLVERRGIFSLLAKCRILKLVTLTGSSVTGYITYSCMCLAGEVCKCAVVKTYLPQKDECC